MLIVRLVVCKISGHIIGNVHCYATCSRLHTEEKMKNYNRTIKFGPGSQPEFYSKKTTSGLWTICVSKGLKEHFVYPYKHLPFF